MHRELTRAADAIIREQQHTLRLQEEADRAAVAARLQSR
jgi:hypothetical protein